jgi:hypothetical protein
MTDIIYVNDSFYALSDDELLDVNAGASFWTILGGVALTAVGVGVASVAFVVGVPVLAAVACICAGEMIGTAGLAATVYGAVKK